LNSASELSDRSFKSGHTTRVKGMQAVFTACEHRRYLCHPCSRSMFTGDLFALGATA